MFIYKFVCGERDGKSSGHTMIDQCIYSNMAKRRRSLEFHFHSNGKRNERDLVKKLGEKKGIIIVSPS